MEVRRQGIKIMLQYHDEIGFDFIKERQDEVKQILLTSIQKANEKLQLNVPLGISIDISRDYSEAH
jgi:DNA polymerase I-like protein with 3'-5' exonuclease and polymerase domains